MINLKMTFPSQGIPRSDGVLPAQLEVYAGVSGGLVWFAKTLADCKINNIAATHPPLFCYNSWLCFDS